MDFKTSEDTITVLEEFVIEPTEFFHVLKTSWDELRGVNTKPRRDEKASKKIWNLGYEEDFNYEEKILCGKILCLIEIALDATYARSMNDKRNYNPKCYVDSSQAFWKQNRELMTENLSLKDEVLKFICDAEFDSEEAEKYLKLDDTKKVYGATELMSVQTEDTRKDTDKTQTHSYTKSRVIKDIKEFRTQLISMVRPSGDAL